MQRQQDIDYAHKLYDEMQNSPPRQQARINSNPKEIYDVYMQS